MDNAEVCFPYEFTLLSNCAAVLFAVEFVCFPYEFTLLSNGFVITCLKCGVCFPYEFTLLSNMTMQMPKVQKFVSPTNLHCSQTRYTVV